MLLQNYLVENIKSELRAITNETRIVKVLIKAVNNLPDLRTFLEPFAQDEILNGFPAKIVLNNGKTVSVAELLDMSDELEIEYEHCIRLAVKDMLQQFVKL